MRGVATAIVILWFFSSAGLTQAVTANCPKTLAIAAEEAAVSWKNWPEAYRWYQHFSTCDDGGVAEGVSDSVTHLLATQWNNLGKFTAITKKDATFEAFVVHHVDCTAADNDLKSVSENLKHCPAGSEHFCKLLKQQLQNPC